MSKTKIAPRLVIGLHKQALTGDRFDTAIGLVEQVLNKVTTDWFVIDELAGYRMYVLRREVDGKRVESVVEDVRSQYAGSGIAFQMMTWVKPPARNKLFKCKDKGLFAMMRPGDDLAWLHFVQTAGLVRKGQLVSPITTKHFGDVNRLLIQGRSRSVYKTMRLLKHNLRRIDSPNYRDLMLSINAARKALDDYTAIHITNEFGDLYSFTNNHIHVNRWGTSYDLGYQEIFEYKENALNCTINNLYDKQRQGDAFEVESIIAASAAVYRYYNRHN